MAYLDQEPRVKENFSYYQSIKQNVKFLRETIIFVSESRNAGTDCGTVSLCSDVSKELSLEVSVKQRFMRTFRFKIIDNNLMTRPCYRFDSDGPPHYNIIDDIPLKKRRVNTPHFHEFNKDGVEIAYQTDVLEKQEEYILSDRSFALAHFAHEENIKYTTSPEICKDGELFSPDNSLEDPLLGESFK